MELTWNFIPKLKYMLYGTKKVHEIQTQEHKM